ncbi:ribosome biogenesis GTPase Der [Heliophilum fasciatum]|uniref:GTPase Der n=1 Tax=Heliophilum fasciatum TaxID=35700 RepID=A0A4R2RJC7_9FIRM|nr:ribosome biogenesis GTPase Der [Heliophilum fasciatum]MCW2278670.1 GTP-binding protein [Heliophilum fasciatum]TCP62609.1 GTP-binding protein [Heliophilum fasciatum]
MARPIVAVVGRPNVGKSTLFNRITGGRVAIVEDQPGVTRDRLYRHAQWGEREFTLVDTGGLELGGAEDNVFSGGTRLQAEAAIAEADVIVFLVDGRQGLTAGDEAIAELLRRSKKPVFLVPNKVEDFSKPERYMEFYSLGLGEPIPISASHGMNTGDLLDTIVAALPPEDSGDEDPDAIKIAFIGRPNVGKSSLVNAMLGEDRVMVSDIPGTTRDAIDTLFERDGKHYMLIDTAGMRRKGKIDEAVERYSVMRSLRAIDRSDVVLMVIDASQGVTEQDKKIAGYAHEAGKPCVLVLNKWDLVVKDDKTMARFDKKVRSELLFLSYAPTIYVSALTKQRLPKILELVDFVVEQNTRRIATSVINEVMADILRVMPAPSDKGRRLKILFVTQADVRPPTFVFFVNDEKLFHFSFKRHIENRFRQTFGFEGSPIRFIIRQREKEKV